MKKNVLRLILLTLLVGLSAYFYVSATPPVFLVDGMTVTHTATDETLFYSLNKTEATALLQDMTGEPQDGVPHASQPTFNITLHVKGMADRNYSLVSTPDLSLYLKKANRIYQLSNILDFFYSHPAFTQLYPYSTPPETVVTGLDEAIPLPYSGIAWEYQQQNSAWITSGTFTDDVLLPPVYSFSNPEDTLRLNIDPAPDIIHLRITDPAGKVRHDGSLETFNLPMFPFNGRHEYALTLYWDGLNHPYRGTATTHFHLDMDLPVVFEPPGPNALQGEMLMFRARHVPEGAEVVLEQTLTSSPVTLFPLEDGYVAYLPTHYGNPPGDYLLSFGIKGKPLQQSTLTLHPRSFHIQYLTISTAVEAATRNEEAAAMTARYFTPSRDNSAPERYYTEDFVIPVRGRLTTEFGETRYVNNAPTSYRHSGLDIAAPTGTPIVAVNRGKVVLAMELITQGNTVVIDHGQGLFSVHFHLHELSTSAGDIVERGEVIGTVGSTGFSTGPHLHFTMSYYRHNLEPGHFLVGEPITYQNAAHHLAP